jgi:superfamily II DNA helicase RecQ
MARYLIPGNAGRFRSEIARAGNFMVINEKTGKNQVIIPCRDRKQAEEICSRLNRGDHDGEIRA